MSKIIPSTPFINVLVSIRETKPGVYDVMTAPATPWVTAKDTVINYQIFDSGNRDIVFTGMSVKPADNNQLSKATISVSGKQLTFSDANTAQMTFNITLHLKDDQGVEFAHDPEVENSPEG
ncbi:hypothetical protein KW842_00650 [Duganella sp. sic0402]|uniref:hypothetical protein n=1 Tax=Duganella sp. sic0402 TaxID=2854786 RepID=UPI001C497B1E|nr:hypothetical protein [Duganella sp. sic0402]MBV7534263.1 hypothetical protein [Duganella sp. sic0402]